MKEGRGREMKEGREGERDEGREGGGERVACKTYVT